jgi:hypothetical protein
MANRTPFEQQHRLSDVDETNCWGTCQVCGPTELVHNIRRGRWQCGVKFQEEQEYDRTYAVSYASEETRARRRELYHERHWKKAIETRYGLPEGWYDTTLAAQGGVCAVCLQDNPNKFGKYSVDHRHVTGKPRALLCGFCNSLLGYANEDPEVLERAAAYLRKHNAHG